MRWMDAGVPIWNRSPRTQKKFPKPSDLWAKCVEYFEFVDTNPLKEKVLINGKWETVEKPRAMSKQALYAHLGIQFNTFKAYKKDYGEDFAFVCEQVENIIFAQKFEYAAAGILQQNIISRELGLAEKTDNKNTEKITINKIVREIVRPDGKKTTL